MLITDAVKEYDITPVLVKGYAGSYLYSGRKASYINGLLKTAKSFLKCPWTEYETGFDTNIR